MYSLLRFERIAREGYSSLFAQDVQKHEPSATRQISQKCVVCWNVSYRDLPYGKRPYAYGWGGNRHEPRFVKAGIPASVQFSRIAPKLRTYVAVSCQEAGLLEAGCRFPRRRPKTKTHQYRRSASVVPLWCSIGFSRNAFLETCKRKHPDANPGFAEMHCPIVPIISAHRIRNCIAITSPAM